MRKDELCAHYDRLIEENNDPVLDPPALRAYMDEWDGEAFFALLGLNGNERVLEIGCGTGRLALRIAPRCGAYYGIDLSEKSLARAREHLSGLENVRLFCGNFLRYPFDASVRFDVICSSLTFMHIRQKQAALYRAAKLLAPDGRLVLSADKSRERILDYGTRRLRVYPDGREGTRRRLERAGFAILREEETPKAYLFLARRRSAAANLQNARPMGLAFCVSCREFC